ncbi:MAG: DUF4876 domain-containing protein [Ignavibacteriae bacterium]|nr:DUF4876 domain-containing protein [Ignavibacteriota bacterium]
MKKFIVAVFLSLILVAGCAENPPSMVDGNGTLYLIAVWDSTDGAVPNAPLLPMSFAKVIILSEYGLMIRETDGNGILFLDMLPATTYTLSARKPNPNRPNMQIVGSKLDVLVSAGAIRRDTVFGQSFSSTGIAINEVYACGPVNSVFYFYDQYIELYNGSDSLRYLDGMMVMRFSGNGAGKGPGGDEGDDGDIDGATYEFKFPGVPGERNYPIAPRQFVVLAQDAVNHSTSCAGAIDLTRANWEFYNQFSGSDIDNPNVPNLINMRSSHTTDFFLSVTNDVVVVSAGRDSNYVDGIDIVDVIDGVEYQTSSNLLKTLDRRVDRGFALSPGSYSGKSMQRREPGSDTNDGIIDFEILNVPTPGRQ